VTVFSKKIAILIVLIIVIVVVVSHCTDVLIPELMIKSFESVVSPLLSNLKFSSAFFMDIFSQS